MASLSIEPGVLNVTAQAGKTWGPLVFTIVDSTGTVVNLTGYSASWAIADYLGATPVLTASTANYVTMGGTAGTITLTMPFVSGTWVVTDGVL